MLVRAGMPPQEADCAEAAVYLFRTDSFDLVITDLIMPGIGGLGLIEALRKYDSKATILAVSGGGRVDNTDVLELARKAGAAATLQKPFGIEALTAAICCALGRATESAH
jgi:DNA-binding response OmpR family regulator